MLQRIASDLDRKYTTLDPVDAFVGTVRTTDVLHNFGAVRDIDGTPVVMLARKGTSDEACVTDVVRTIVTELVCNPEIPRRAWSPLPSGLVQFDEVMLIPPSLFKTMLDNSTIWMKDIAWKAVPTFRCEHPAEETVGEAEAHMRLISYDWKRAPEPFTRIRFAREKTSIRSTGGKRKALFKWAEVQRIFGTLATDDGFLEIQNFEGEDARIDHRGGYSVSFRGAEKGLAADDAKAWLHTFAIQGAEEAAKALAE